MKSPVKGTLLFLNLFPSCPVVVYILTQHLTTNKYGADRWSDGEDYKNHDTHDHHDGFYPVVFL